MSLTTLLQNDLGDCDPALKKRFHREAKKLLRIVAKTMGLSTKDYDLRSNVGGPAVSGEITLHTDNVYVQVSQSYMGNGKNILVRACDGRKDYTGKVNHWAPVTALSDTHQFIGYLKVVAKGLAIGQHWVDEQVRSDIAHDNANQIMSPEVEEVRRQYEYGAVEIDDFEGAIQAVANQRPLVMPVQMDLF